MSFELTDQQQQIVNHLDGTILVLAAVGSGKTTTLTRRIAHALEEGLLPERVLALTFTNRAATHMREQIAETCPGAARLIQVRTFHSLCAWILRSEAEHLGIPPDFSIYDEEDTDALLMELGDINEKSAANLRNRMHDELARTRLSNVSTAAYFSGEFSDNQTIGRYTRELLERGAVDFAGLVYLARAVFAENEACRKRWSRRFDLVSVDELQDTHRSEYDVLRVVAANARSLCLVGDLDQTIYGWRGSDPKGLIDAVEKRFGPVTRYNMDINFRATKALVRAADGVAGMFRERFTQVEPHTSLPEGSPVSVEFFHSDEDEYMAIAEQCADLIRNGMEPENIAVLARANATADSAAAAFAGLGIPHTTTEQLRFFRRNEVKDVLALMRLSVPPLSESAARRALFNFWPEKNTDTKNAVFQGMSLGVRLADLLAQRIVDAGDPLWGLETDTVIVLDTETTGLSVVRDDVIEIAAVRLQNGQETARFHRFIRPSHSVGASEYVHGFSDEYLEEHGEDAAAVMADFRDFIGHDFVAGHNVTFDCKMLRNHARRVGITLAFHIAFDTMDVARRLLRTQSYRLEDLAVELGLPPAEAHQAMNDVETTVHLANHLRTESFSTANARRAFMHAMSPVFEDVRGVLAEFVSYSRPTDLLKTILEHPVVQRRFADNETAKHVIARLVRYIERIDDTTTPCRQMIYELLDGAALMRDVDTLDDMRGVRILTVHQAKGLEFDVVFLPCMVESGFPTFFALRDAEGGDEERLEEERRVFYVAVTRPKKELRLSWHCHERYSSYIRGISSFLTQSGLTSE